MWRYMEAQSSNMCYFDFLTVTLESAVGFAANFFVSVILKELIFHLKLTKFVMVEKWPSTKKAKKIQLSISDSIRHN